MPVRSRGSRRTPSTLVAALALLTLACCGEDGPRSESQESRAADCQNLLLVTFDTTRADHVGCYGHPRARTPVIDGLAREGVLFERCFSATPVTLPSHATLLTGLHPFRHGARNNGTHYVSPEVATLAEVLGDAGFTTGAFVSAMVLEARFGLAQGFDVYDDDLSGTEREAAFMYRERPAAATVERALDWLAQRAGERWFLWVHLFDPHADYAPPEPFATDFADALYDGEIAYADAQLGRLVERLASTGRLDETLVVVTADHGESLGEHGEQTHSIFVYDATTRVPLVMRHPALDAGLRVEQVTSAVDVAPTALALLGVDGLAGVDGRDLGPLVTGAGDGLTPLAAYSESMTPFFTRGWSDLRTLRAADERYVRAPRPELYELGADPGELDDRSSREPDRLARAAARLRALLPEREAGLEGAGLREVSVEERRALDALGYALDEELDRSADELTDPKDGLVLSRRHNDAGTLVEEGRLEEAIAAYRALLEDDPRALISRTALAALLTEQGLVREAYELLTVAVQEPGFTAGALMELAELERGLHLEAWRGHVERAKRMGPRDPEVHAREGEWAKDDGDPARARSAYEQALELDPGCVEALVGMGDLLCRMARHAEAEPFLERATGLDPDLPQAWFNRGVAAMALGRMSEALEHYRRAAALDPEHLPARVNLGLLQAQRGELAPAEASFREALRIEPNALGALFGLGRLQLAQGRYDAAVESFAAAAAAHPTRAGPWRELAGARRATGDLAGALAAARTLLELEPEDVGGRLLAAVFCAGLGRDDAARAWLDEARARAPELVERAAAGDPELGALVRRYPR